MDTTMNNDRMSLTAIQLVQWGSFQGDEFIPINGSVLLTGASGSGKSTILDAMIYLLTGNSGGFNKAAGESSRSIRSYVRGDTNANGEGRYLRSGNVVSYIAMEFFNPMNQGYFVIGVCIESANEQDNRSFWFIKNNTRLNQVNFIRTEIIDGKKKMFVTPKNQLCAKGIKFAASEFLSPKNGTEQVRRVLGIRGSGREYSNKLMKMLAVNVESNIDKFIKEYVFEAGETNSLAQLKEQKERYDEASQVYDGLSNSKDMLREIDRIATEYEKKKERLEIQTLLLDYQKIRELEASVQILNQELDALQAELKNLNIAAEDANEELKQARERKAAAENNNDFAEMMQIINARKRSLEKYNYLINENEKKTADLITLKGNTLKIIKAFGEEFSLTNTEKYTLEHLSEANVNIQGKISVFQKLSGFVSNKKELLGREKYRCEEQKEKLKNELGEIQGRINKLKSNIIRYPEDSEKAKSIIAREFREKGIPCEPHFFAELVSKVKDKSWQAAIEQFLKYKRFSIIVDGPYCHLALEILQKNHLPNTGIVITDKLTDEKIKEGSAAELLDIPNVYARRYANYLLNGIHLCDTLEELHNYPKGGIMRDGLLAKSMAASAMDLNKVRYYMGSDAVRQQMEQEQKEKAETLNALNRAEDNLRRIRQQMEILDKLNLSLDYYDFSAPDKLKENQEKAKAEEAGIRELEKNPGFAALLKEQAEANKLCEMAEKKQSQTLLETGKCQQKIIQKKVKIEQVNADIPARKKDYLNKCEEHSILEEKVAAEYERLLKTKQGNSQVISSSTVERADRELRQLGTTLTDAHYKYCRSTNEEEAKAGPEYIGYYRECYRNIANIRIEEAKNKLNASREKLENVFMNDFVAELDGKIRAAKEEKDLINRELKRIPFGNDSYQFVMEEKDDHKDFFRICRRLNDYMGAEGYMASTRDDDEMEDDIRSFMNTVLEEPDETEYTDYRNYFTYNMKIISERNGQEVTADLSKKQKSASNGEKQTPYFIILAASLARCYPRNSCCARLIFVDEAFAALSPERTEQMIKYFDDNHFQVIYAAPDKIDTIGSRVNTNILFVKEDGYTHAVLGIEKGDVLNG